MLRIHFIQHWFNLADLACEEAQYDSASLRRFVGIDLGREPVPDATTLLKSRRLLNDNKLGQPIVCLSLLFDCVGWTMPRWVPRSVLIPNSCKRCRGGTRVPGIDAEGVFMPTGITFGQIAIVLGFALGGIWAATQWTAAALGYQARLGLPWFDLFGTPIYHPWRLFEWWYFFDAYAPDEFLRGGIIEASSGLLATAAAITMAVWRSRLSRRVTTYGSARRAEPEEVRAAGLTQPTGVFLGRLRTKEGDYLRHEGPEHVMAFAPTRSGKGVGLVVPTLLS
jgi:hypothetical protein